MQRDHPFLVGRDREYRHTAGRRSLISFRDSVVSIRGSV
jgi:hypothetical protein